MVLRIRSTRGWRSSRGLLLNAALFTAIGCLPRSDLSVYSSGGSAGQGMAGAQSTAGDDAGGDAGVGGGDVQNIAGTNTAGISATGGAQTAGTGGAGTAGSNTGGTAGLAGTPGCSDARPLPDSPLELPASAMPGYVTGTVTCDPNANWSVGLNIDEPAFRIETPTAVYYLHAASGAIVSVSKDDVKKPQWVQYSWNYGNDRGLPILTDACCHPPTDAAGTSSPKMVTTRDTAKSNAKHQRVNSHSEDNSWVLTWDFYPSHATVTIETAPVAYGFAVRSKPRGGPGEEVDVAVWLSGAAAAVGVGQSSDKDLPSPEWMRLSQKSNTGESLFVIQHRDDCLPDGYTAPAYAEPGNTYELSFGSNTIAPGTRTRYSFGLSSSQKTQAEARIAYVIAAMQ